VSSDEITRTSPFCLGTPRFYCGDFEDSDFHRCMYVYILYIVYFCLKWGGTFSEV
jgi:hypothetical protein